MKPFNVVLCTLGAILGGVWFWYALEHGNADTSFWIFVSFILTVVAITKDDQNTCLIEKRNRDLNDFQYHRRIYAGSKKCFEFLLEKKDKKITHLIENLRALQHQLDAKKLKVRASRPSRAKKIEYRG